MDVPVHLRSHWLTEVLGTDRVEPAPFKGEARADVCILGGGYTGMWTALHGKALEPTLEVTILEKDICGRGACGRNAGFLMSWASRFRTLQKVCGPQVGLRLLRASQDTIEKIAAFGKTPEVEAGVRQDGWIWAASNEAQFGYWDETLEALDKVGAQAFTPMSRDNIARRMTSRAYQAGAHERQVATLQPAKLALGLRRAELEAGVRIHANTPVIRIARGRPVRVHTPRGTVRAETLVFALNAWAAEHRTFRSSLRVVASDHHLTEPAPELLDELGLCHGAAISDSRLLAQSMRTTPDGRVDFSKGGSHSTFAGHVSGDFDGRSNRRESFHATFRANFPALAGLKLAVDWRGPVTRTATGLHFLGACPVTPTSSMATAIPATGSDPPLSADASSPRSPLGARTSGASAPWPAAPSAASRPSPSASWAPRTCAPSPRARSGPRIRDASRAPSPQSLPAWDPPASCPKEAPDPGQPNFELEHGRSPLERRHHQGERRDRRGAGSQASHGRSGLLPDRGRPHRRRAQVRHLKALQRHPQQRSRGMDSSVRPTHGDQEGTAYNGHFGCTCYHPLFVVNQFGDLERCALRPGNVHSAHEWRDVLDPVVARYRDRLFRRHLREDAAFVLPRI
jgi:glycine/D-amino acid oxidase-like deaminating enzyme